MPAARLRPLRPRPAPYAGLYTEHVKHERTRSPSPLPEIPTLAVPLETPPPKGRKKASPKPKPKAKATAKVKTKADPDPEPESPEGAQGGKGGYDRALLLTLVAKVSCTLRVELTPGLQGRLRGTRRERGEDAYP